MSAFIKHKPAPAKRGALVWTDRGLLFVLRSLAWGEPTLGRRTFRQRRSGPSPSTELYERRFGSWNNALELAGLSTVEQPSHLQGATTKWTEDQVLDTVRQCLDATGSTAIAVYEAWRKGETDGSNKHHVPPAATIRFRMGSWSHATQLAVG